MQKALECGVTHPRAWSRMTLAGAEDDTTTTTAAERGAEGAAAQSAISERRAEDRIVSAHLRAEAEAWGAAHGSGSSRRPRRNERIVMAIIEEGRRVPRRQAGLGGLIE